MSENKTPNPEMEEVTLKKSEYEDIVNKLKISEDVKSNLVSEIKELREKKQLSDTEKETLAAKLKQLETPTVNPDDITPDKISEVISRSLDERFSAREKVDVSAKKESALKQFRNSHKEFHVQNDEAGIKFSAFEKQLSRFNLDFIKNEQDFVNAFEDAYILLNKKQKEVVDNPENPYSATPHEVGSAPVVVEDSKLTPKELKIIESTFGGDKKRYLDQRAKRPDYVAKLLNYV